MQNRMLKNLVIWGPIFIIVVFICYVYLVFQLFVKPIGVFSDAGAFGDMFGGISAFFTAFALIGLAITIILQVKENERVKTQIKDQKEEIIKEKKNDNYRKYLNCLFTTQNELKFYLEKFRQLSSEINNAIQDAKSGQTVILPTYTFYPSFLEKQKIDLSGFFYNSVIIKDVGHCHFELCHIVNRLDLYKSEMKGRNSQNLAMVLWNANGFKGLVDLNINTFNSLIKLMDTEIETINNKVELLTSHQEQLN